MNVAQKARRTLGRALTAAGKALWDTGTSPSAAFYRGARNDQWNGDWNVPQVSATQILRADLTTLVDRARDLVMNNATAARVPTLFAENITGKDGILYQATVKTSGDTFDEVTNEKLEDAWERWADDHTQVTADRRLNWHEVQTQLDEVEATDGETFTRKLPGFDNKFRFAIQILDTDQIDRRLYVDGGEGRNAIHMGVEIDSWGGAVAYHVWPNHPSEVARRGERLRIPADQIIHQGLFHRPGGVRAVPWLAPVIVLLNQHGEYTEAEVKAARIAAAKMGFIQSEGDPMDLTEAERTAMVNARIQRGISWDAEPGAIEQLGPGQTFKDWNPLHPNGNYDAFDKAILRSVATALRISYMSLSGDLSQTSYASGRLGFLAERMVYQTLAQRKITRVCRPIHAAWLPNALLTGQIDVGSFDVARLSASIWHARTFPGIDVSKEADANDHDVAMGINSLTALAAERGLDIEDVFKQRAREIALAEQYNVPLSLHYATKVPTPAEPGNADPPGTASDTNPTKALQLMAAV